MSLVLTWIQTIIKLKKQRNEKHTCSLSSPLDLQLSLRDFLLPGCEAVDLNGTPRRERVLAWTAMLVLAGDWDNIQHTQYVMVLGSLHILSVFFYLGDMDSLVLVRHENQPSSSPLLWIRFFCFNVLKNTKESKTLKQIHIIWI